jgi:DNA polymerase III delta prime subunit
MSTVNQERKMFRALALEDVYQAVKKTPLKIEELETFYKDTKEARGGEHPRKALARVLKNSKGSKNHLLLIGNRGCGKSTELHFLQKELGDVMLILNLKLSLSLDLSNLHYVELFILLMEQLFEVAKKEKLDIRPELLAKIKDWVKSIQTEDLTYSEATNEAEMGAETKIGLPYLSLVKFFAKFRSSLKASSSFKTIITNKVEPKLSDLIQHCNFLILEIRNELKRTTLKSDIVVFVEDLDKVGLEKAKEIFINHSSQLNELQCNVVYSFPISLHFSPSWNIVLNSFDGHWMLPMIKVNNKDGSRFEPGINAMRDIVHSRMDEGLFEEPQLLNEMIHFSGGCLRDLFGLIYSAADYALDEDRQLISRQDVHRSFSSLKKDYAANLSESYLDNDTVVLVEEYVRVLVDLCGNPKKFVNDTRAALQLRHNLCILTYNGEGWVDVHPAVKEILIERGEWDGQVRTA